MSTLKIDLNTSYRLINGLLSEISRHRYYPSEYSHFFNVDRGSKRSGAKQALPDAVYLLSSVRSKGFVLKLINTAFGDNLTI